MNQSDIWNNGPRMRAPNDSRGGAALRLRPAVSPMVLTPLTMILVLAACGGGGGGGGPVTTAPEKPDPAPPAPEPPSTTQADETTAEDEPEDKVTTKNEATKGDGGATEEETATEDETKDKATNEDEATTGNESATKEESKTDSPETDTNEEEEPMTPADALAKDDRQVPLRPPPFDEPDLGRPTIPFDPRFSDNPLPFGVPDDPQTPKPAPPNSQTSEPDETLRRPEFQTPDLSWSYILPDDPFADPVPRFPTSHQQPGHRITIRIEEGKIDLFPLIIGNHVSRPEIFEPELDVPGAFFEGPDANRFHLALEPAEPSRNAPDRLVIKFSTKPDFERPADTDGNNTYEFSLGAYLASLWGDLTFEVTVLDAPEPVTTTPDPIVENPAPIVEDPVPIGDFPDPFVGLPEF